MGPSLKEKAPEPSPPEPDTHFTVFIRLPFPRGDFVDPPPIDWDAAKDRALWQILSGASKGSEIEWPTLFATVVQKSADEFGVSLPFLLQQAAWLYERQLSQVREQLRKVSRPTSLTPSSTPVSVSGSTTVGGQSMKRVGSGGSRVPSSLSVRARDPPNTRAEGSTSSSPVPPKPAAISRSLLTNTVYETHKQTIPTTQQSTGEEQSPRPHPAVRRPPQASPNQTPRSDGRPTSPPIAVQDSSSSSPSSSSSDDPIPLTKSRAFTRRPRFSSVKPTLGPLSSTDEDSEDSPAFLPFSSPIHDAPIDPTATLRLPQQPRPTTTITPTIAVKPTTLHSSSSSTNSATPARPATTHAPRPPHGALSPRRATELGLSPRQYKGATGNDGAPSKGSDGTPSMGSSFSDLDDASVTQSALEEALARDMQHGGVASRMSTISQALRSRYL